MSYFALFGMAFLQVMLVAMNTRQVSQARYPGAFLVGFGISAVWAFNVHFIAVTDIWHALAYAGGAACGTVTGIYVTKRIYGI